MSYQVNAETGEQIAQCINVLKDVLGKGLLGVYLY